MLTEKFPFSHVGEKTVLSKNDQTCPNIFYCQKYISDYLYEWEFQFIWGVNIIFKVLLQVAREAHLR